MNLLKDHKPCILQHQIMTGTIPYHMKARINTTEEKKIGKS